MTKGDSTVNVRLYKRIPIYVMLAMVNRWLASPTGNWKVHTVFIRTEMLLFSDISCAADWFSEWQIAKCMITWYSRGEWLQTVEALTRLGQNGVYWIEHSCIRHRYMVGITCWLLVTVMAWPTHCPGLSRYPAVNHSPHVQTPFSQLLATQVVTPLPWSMGQ